ncbi:hypothetical protein Tco_0559602, partial [Tanacetum coccineum]
CENVSCYTQSNGFVLDPDHNKGKTSHEVEPDADTIILTTVADIQALLIDSEDELKDDSDDDVFEAGEEMDEDIQEPDTEETQTHHSTKQPILREHQFPSPPKDDLDSSKSKNSSDASDSKSSLCSETFKPYDNYMPITERQLHEEAIASYADLKWSIDDFHSTTFNQYKNTDTALRNFERIFDRIRTDQASGLNRILDN